MELAPNSGRQTIVHMMLIWAVTMLILVGMGIEAWASNFFKLVLGAYLRVPILGSTVQGYGFGS